MDKRSSKVLPQTQQHIDPYQLISILNKKLKSQAQSVEWYKKMFQTAEYQKKITMNQLKKKKGMIESLKVHWATQKEQRKDYELELEQLRSKLNKIQRLGLTTLNNSLTPSIGQKQSFTISPYSRNSSKQYISTVLRSKNFPQKPFSSQLSLQMKHSEIYNILNPQPISRVLEQKNINYSHQQFVPCDIKLVERTHKSSFANSSSQSFLNMSVQLMNQTIDEPISQKPGEFFVEDFLVFGPDVSELKKKRQENRNAQQLQVKPAVLYACNSKVHNQQVYTQIAMRCFPFRSKVKRQFVESYQELKDIVQFLPNNKLSSDCLVLTLKGQPSQVARNSKAFKRSNLSQIEYVICIKLPDFVWLTKDQKHYQRPQQQIWVVEKYYAIVSYYPIIDVHINILCKMHAILMKDKLQKILIQKQKFYSFDIRRNMLDLQKNQSVKGIIDYFKSYKPQLGEVLFFKTHYYGTIPPQGQAEYYVAKLTAPIFMTTFSFEEMLLLLIGLFCQKSIALISKDQGVATLCALFLINVLTPFPYSFSILLNVDEQKISPFIFEYPFPMISTIKKTQQNIHSILQSYACARIEKKGIKQEAQKMILVDVDTNSIFYQGHQSFQPLIAMSRPGDEFMQQYMKVNSSYSKSYSFPKKMDQRKEAEQVNKREQQRNKIIQDMQHTIKSHVTKLPSFELTPQIHKTLLMLLKYVRSFAVDGRDLAEALQQLRDSKYHDVLRRALAERHPSRAELVQKIINSQYYADYLNLFVQ